MGAGIATAHARSGIPATIVDIDDDRLGAGMASAQKTVAGRIKIGRATEQDMANMLSLLSTSTSHDVFSSCDVVVEAVTENEDLKTKLFGMIGPKMKDDAILCSNTSTISITRMAESAPKPENFCGMHFFFPVDRMQLVEVIRGEKTSDETVATIVALAKRIKKVPIVCGDCPGFLVNRILLPYMNEAVLMLTEGASMKQIDKVATKFGLPVGPLALHDMVGMDTAYYAGQTMVKGFADRAVVSPLLGAMVEAGRLGKKSGAGFRQYVGKRKKPADDPAFTEFFEKYRVDSKEFTDQEIEDRLMLPMLMEATRILDEHIVREPAHVDMGLILGIGFPPFRGGLLHWSDSEGAGEIMKRLENYQSLGKRFEATESFAAMATSDKTFF
ncbi:UNVERIFIED_CONTAM: hypothetical protein GTU68_033665 [Idotea baltica]|nr:hypothetical protein [Idotea baltica]